ncbi:MAG: hypothetical protein R6V12_18740 [Candidatus Hydrogenedentota bacterium]
MTDRTIQIASAGEASEDGWARIDWRVVGLDSGEFRLSHAVPEPDRDLFGDLQRADHAVCAVLLKAMEHGRDIVVEGTVSPKLLDGLEHLQAIWHRWRPHRYQRIRIRADQESEATPVTGERPAIFAFSGGVDASFSLFRHLQGQAGRNNRTPGGALLVHGMDIPLGREDFYCGAVARADRILDGTGIRLIRMRTNSRQLGQDWEDSFGLQLTSCFLLFQHVFSAAISGSGEPYDTLVLPWGSTPLTDHLASTKVMKREHDGCAYDRTEKVEWLIRHTDIVDDLRVCWAGPSLDRNCGECEKCVRTMLNFWAIGHQVPAAFPTQLTPKLVSTVRPRNEAQLRELTSLFRHSEKHCAGRDPITRSLRAVLRRARLSVFVRQVLRALVGRRTRDL